jgi:hypothetical protein
VGGKALSLRTLFCAEASERECRRLKCLLDKECAARLEKDLLLQEMALQHMDEQRQKVGKCVQEITYWHEEGRA